MSFLKRGEVVTLAIERQCLHKAKKEVLLEQRIRDELALLEKLSNTDLEDNTIQTLMDVSRENYRWVL